MLVAFEHHLFEKMGETAAVGGIVFRTDVIPDLDSDGRALVILDGVNLQPVRQRGVFERQRWNGDGLAGRRAFRAAKRRRESEREQNEAKESFHESPIP